MSRFLKTVIGFLIFNSGLYRIFFRNKALVVLFHRVDDRYPTNQLTCTVATFEKFTRFFTRFFVVVSLGDLVEKLRAGQDISRHLAITFDDGYKDNLELAAPILKKFNAPCCFFIATEFIETTRVPWWDEEVGIASDWMSWDQVRELRNQGFDLGAHTCNHVNLGVVAGQEAEREIAQSGVRLERETGTPVAWFSYPYGRRDTITEENRDIVRRVGYGCCVSAYGGLVTPATDLFNVPRMNIDQWHRTTYQFGLEAMKG